METVNTQRKATTRKAHPKEGNRLGIVSPWAMFGGERAMEDPHVGPRATRGGGPEASRLQGRGCNRLRSWSREVDRGQGGWGLRAGMEAEMERAGGAARSAGEENFEQFEEGRSL